MSLLRRWDQTVSRVVLAWDGRFSASRKTIRMLEDGDSGMSDLSDAGAFQQRRESRVDLDRTAVLPITRGILGRSTPNGNIPPHPHNPERIQTGRNLGGVGSPFGIRQPTTGSSPCHILAILSDRDRIHRRPRGLSGETRSAGKTRNNPRQSGVSSRQREFSGIGINPAE